MKDLINDTVNKEIIEYNKNVKVELPNIVPETLTVINNITASLGVPRNVLASEDEISYGWALLPRELNLIPEELRGPLLVRMCVATSIGLFDGAINYIWNASIANLQTKVKNFGYHVVGQIQQKQFNEKDLFDLKDSELLDLCLKINLISEDGYYFLGQCRDMRNNYSIAHPNEKLINDRELITYINRCVTYALSSGVDLKGVDIKLLTQVIKQQAFSDEQLSAWIKNIKETHDAQREMIFSMLHGIYCGNDSSEETRLNALKICSEFKEKFTDNIISELLNRHHSYKVKGNKEGSIASQQFFEKLGLIKYLCEEEKHNIIFLACKRLLNVHLEMNNFYNEPPFAERLEELVCNNEIPNTVKYKFVKTVVTCYVGNAYGQSNAALFYYSKMIKNFTPAEIKIMLELSENKKTTLYYRISSYSKCMNNYKEAINLLNQDSIPVSLKNQYNKLLKI